MFFLYSKSCEYAVRGLLEAAKECRSKESCFTVRKICRKAKVPVHYTRKIIEQLAVAKIVEPVRGRSGGYRFKVMPERLSILRLIKAVDGDDAFNRCVMGLSECGDHHPCPLHEVWQGVKKKYLAELSQKTLYDLVITARKPHREFPFAAR